jgi:hypothetical protein
LLTVGAAYLPHPAGPNDGKGMAIRGVTAGRPSDPLGEPHGLRLRLTAHEDPCVGRCRCGFRPTGRMRFEYRRGGRELGDVRIDVQRRCSRERPTGPPWPPYPADDYTYDLELTCFCAVNGPLIITVQGGKVTDVVYGRGARGHSPGQHVSGRWLRMTINDVIHKANDPGSHEVEVRWPRAQAYPSSVWIDRRSMPVDGGVEYQARHVRPMADTVSR